MSRYSLQVHFGLLLSFGLLSTTLPFTAGCGRERQPTNVKPIDDDAVMESDSDISASAPIEVTAQQLLAARIPADEAAEGWIRLFDGHTLFGWDIAGNANWQVENGAIVVDQGEMSLLCTTVPWLDFELHLEFKATEKTNSGIFLRTPLQPQDPGVDCYEVNIAWDEHQFPTASVVDRSKVESGETTQNYNQWRAMKISLNAGKLQVFVDGELANEYEDDNPLPTNRIGLQHNSGRIEFRDIRLKPLGLHSMLDKELSQWTKYPQMPGDFTVNDEGWLRVRGGRTQLESKQSFGDFILLSEFKLPTAEMNSGIFFRCIPGDEMMGYECQLSNGFNDANRLSPIDCGTGGIFRRQDARIVAGEVDQWTTVVLVAHQETIAAWVNGLQVSNWYDDRQPNENPRQGRRLEPGTLMIQGHDAGTDALLKQIRVRSLDL